MAVRLTQKKFIEKCKRYHGKKYDYSKVNYVNSNSLINIICSEHGPFKQRAFWHSRGGNCQKCAIKYPVYSKYFKSFEEWEKIVQTKHKNNLKYIFNKKSKFTSKSKITIKCDLHGKFKETARKILDLKYGCIKCSNKKRYTNSSKSTRRSLKKWLTCFHIKHDNLYTYNKKQIKKHFINSKSKIPIKCPYHGIFFQKVRTHADGSGCPICGKIKSQRSFSKPFKLEKNRVIFIRGYEIHAINKIIKLGISKKYIEQPKPKKYKYKDKGKYHRYYIDLKVKNTYIEVKSDWTLFYRGWRKNKIKFREMLKRNINIKLWLIRNKKVVKIPEKWFLMSRKQFQAWLIKNKKYESDKTLLQSLT